MQPGFLTLSRKKDESIIYELPDGQRIEVKVSSIRGDKVRIASKAPEGVRIMRAELLEPVSREDGGS